MDEALITDTGRLLPLGGETYDLKSAIASCR